MSGVVLLTLAAAAASACLLTYGIWKLALARGMLDLPNERSSHTVATPRGGGVAIALTVSAALVGLALSGEMRPELAWALLGGGSTVALVGFVDDRHPLPAPVRLAVHLGAALWAVFWLGGLPALMLHHQLVHLGWFGTALAVVAVMWVLNLFNFMDGIDGIAASEAIFVCAAALLPMVWSAVSADVSVATALVAAAAFGFLRWNWPPARIFLGDAGSGYLGYAIATLALAAARQSPVLVWVWLILGGVFFVDATLTLVRRLSRRERVHQAHRTHAYQWLARRWGSHRRVTLLVLAIDVLWLLPCALWATLHADSAALLTLTALLPLVVLALAAGAGRPETRDGI